MSLKITFACCLSVLALSSVPSARADEVQSFAAQALFDEARALMEAKRFSEACPKLAESQRLDPASGTLLNLAVCHEREGKTASAWIGYTETITLAAKEGNQERQRLARERIADIESELSRLRVLPPKRIPDGYWVRLDDVSLAAAAWDTGVPVDPGVHRVTSGAPGTKVVSRTVEVSKPGVTLELRLSELEREKPAPPRPADRRAPVPPPSDARPLLVAASFGVGAAGFAVGAYAGVRAGMAWNERDANCVGGCNEKAVAAGEDANDFAVVSNIAFATGIVALGVGTYLVLTTPEAETRTVVRVGAQVSGRETAIVAKGTF
jgi:hypothetical protein